MESALTCYAGGQGLIPAFGKKELIIQMFFILLSGVQVGSNGTRHDQTALLALPKL